MGKYFLAIDIGASSGRHILGSIENGKIELEEIYRFWNGMDKVDGSLVWDVDRLFNEIVAGMKKAKEWGKVPESVGIDTWGVDYVLLDENDEIVGKTYGYRDHRTDGRDEDLYKLIPEDELYARTGIQKAMYNTIYQLMALKLDEPEVMNKAKAMLMVPDYFHYKLSGVKANEYSEASTSQLLNPTTRQWDMELIERLGFNKEMFLEIKMPGDVLGDLLPEVAEAVGYNCKVVVPPTHDTASAVLAVPSNAEDTCYISSGTWSLMGVESDTPNCSPKSKELNLTNEGGYAGKITYLANIMGLWMIQSIRNEMDPDISFGDMCEQASKETIETIVDCQDDCFLSPDSMVEAIKTYCIDRGYVVPRTLPEFASVVYNSLAKCYADKLEAIQTMTGVKYDRINIIGGGSNAGYLNELTAKSTGLPVYAGPGEATAIGNILSQMLSMGVFADVKAARECVRTSFEVKVYNP